MNNRRLLPLLFHQISICLLGVVIFSLLLGLVVVNHQVSADGWNAKKILYHKFNKGVLEEGKRQQKPIMLIIHKTWCPTCKILRKKVEESAEIEALSEYFVMAHAEDDDEPSDERYSPNGAYSPRTLFINPENGDLYPIKNPVASDPNAPHFYGSIPEMVRGMVAALQYTSGIGHLDEL